MSFDMTKLVLEMYKGGTTEKLLAVSLANFADDDGTSIRPSVPTLADMINSDVRTVQRHLRLMKDDGSFLVYVRENLGGRPSEYMINPIWRDEALKKRAAKKEAKGVKYRNKRGSPKSNATVTSTQQTVTSVTQNGDIVVSPNTSIQNIKDHLPVVESDDGFEKLTTPLNEVIAAELSKGNRIIVNPTDDLLMEWIDKGLTLEEAIKAADDSVKGAGREHHIPMSYLSKTLKTNREKHRDLSTYPADTPDEKWILDDEEIAKKAYALGLVNSSYVDSRKRSSEEFQLRVLRKANVSAAGMAKWQALRKKAK